MSILLKDLSGVIVDIVKKKQDINIIKERRKYERERIDSVYNDVYKG